MRWPWAVGVFFSGDSQLDAYDLEENLIAGIIGGASGRDHFLGIVSDVPIGSAVIDALTWTAIADSFQFTPIPEPASLILLGVGGGILTGTKLRPAGVAAVVTFTSHLRILSGETG